MTTMDCVQAYRYDREGREFDPAFFDPIENTSRNKPEGGCWFSPIVEDYPYGWYEWVTEENFYIMRPEHRREFMIEGKILVIDADFDPNSIPCVPSPDNKHPDFEALVGMGYDAIMLTKCGMHRFHSTVLGEFELYGWDCESVLVLNPKAVSKL